MSKSAMFTVASLVASLALSSVAFAQAGAGIDVGVGVGVGAGSANANANANATATVGQAAQADGAQRASTTANVPPVAAQGAVTAEENRSAVANLVMDLKELGLRDPAVRAELIAVATAQASSSEQAAEAQARVESRSFLKQILLGSDYKNLGELRAALVTTENNIARLEKAVERTTDAQVKAGIEAQIEVLNETSVDIEAFIEDHEGSFSFFGWFVRMFSN